VPHPIGTARLDAHDSAAVADLITKRRAGIVLHLALPYQNLSIMEACLNTGAHYLDTALAEDPGEPDAFYDQQWALHDPFTEAGVTGLLGCGFDPGVTNIFCAYARKHLFDEIRAIDIVDCNGGDHGLPFATNFNPEINLRELGLPGRYWENGALVETPPMEISETFDFPEVGPRRMYLIWHEEIESLARFLPGVQRIRFWMTFSDSYLEHLRVLQNVGLTRTDPVYFEGREIVPLSFLSSLLPDPSDLGPRTRGKTCIGCLVEGLKDGAERKVFIYNVCDHEAAYRDVGAQAVSYTTGIPAAIGAALIAQGDWRRPGIYNPEQFDPDPFMEKMPAMGLPWTVEER
jgi:saccharopine dehydrogenase (NAD+, L-lysine-forming)